jgi:hypothetical protein
MKKFLFLLTLIAFLDTGFSNAAMPCKKGKNCKNDESTLRKNNDYKVKSYKKHGIGRNGVANAVDIAWKRLNDRF